MRSLPASLAAALEEAGVQVVHGLVVHRGRPLEVEERDVGRPGQRDALGADARGADDQLRPGRILLFLGGLLVPATLPEPLALPTARCGFLVVPENRSQADGRTIRLAVAIVPAVSPQPAPLVSAAPPRAACSCTSRSMTTC